MRRRKRTSKTWPSVVKNIHSSSQASPRIPLTGCIICQDIRRLATYGRGQWTHSALRGSWNVIAIGFCSAIPVQCNEGETITSEPDIHVVPGTIANELVLGSHLAALDHRCRIANKTTDPLR